MYLLKKIVPDEQIGDNEYTAKFITVARSEDQNELYKMIPPEAAYPGEYLIIHEDMD